MRMPLALLKVIGKGVLNAVGGGIAGDVLVEALPEVARDVCGWWKKDRTHAERRADVEALARAPAAEVRQVVQQVVAEAAGDKPREVQIALSLYLSQLPAAVRQSLRRPADPAGVTAPPLLALEEPDDVLPLLPARLPRFQPGDRPLPGIDWELVELLGAGGFGEVWKAKNPHFDAVPPVALKFCLDPSAKDRLLRHEAAILNQVMRQGRHPGIVPLQHTYLSADPPCLEYEYVAGGDLAGLVQEWRHLPPGAERAARVTGLLHDLAETVGFAHRLGPPVVHRDLKPANVLVEQGEGGALRLRVADFGIGGVAAGRALGTRRDVSQGNFLVTALRGAHTPLYASPQQVCGRPADPRDDVYSLGVIWYQFMTGNLVSRPPSGTRWPRRLVELGLSEQLVDLLGSCMEEEPAHRPADAAVLAERMAGLTGTSESPAKQEAGGANWGGSLFGLRPPADPPKVNLPSSVTNSVGMKLSLIQAGWFWMGSPAEEAQRGDDEGPRRRVTIGRPFYLGVHPVTQRAFEKVMGRNPAQFRKGQGGSPEHPVEQVSWEDAAEFCRKLSAAAAEKEAGRSYRLPTEAEWEYACRAGTETPFSFGDALSSTQANFDGSHPYGSGKPGPHLGHTSKAGSYPANAWGLCDLHGNVWEWCADWYDADYYQNGLEYNPAGPTRGTQRVLRGGSWNNSGHLCRAARRQKYAPDFRNDTIGFRVVLTV